MFSFGGALATHELDQDRDPPPRPTAIAFPRYDRLEKVRHRSWQGKEPPNLFPLFANIRKPTDASLDHFEALNVKVQHSCSIDSLVPKDKHGNTYLPPKDWLEPPESDADPPAPIPANGPLLSSGRPVPDHETFYTRAKELLADNEDAYKVITRTPDKGKVMPRLAHFRRFWEGMESLSHYWDSSADDYYLNESHEDAKKETEAECKHPEKSTGDSDVPVVLNSSAPPPIPPRKRPKMGDDITTPLAEGKETVLLDRTSTTQPPPAANRPNIPPRSSSASSQPQHPPTSSHSQSASSSPSKKPPSPLRYRGHRIASGAQTPVSFLTDTLRTFTEASAWPHGSTLATPRRLPQLQIAASVSPHSPAPPRSGKLLLPVRLNALAYRSPQERTRARAGWVEGPILGLWGRNDTLVGRVRHDPYGELSEASRAAMERGRGRKSSSSSSSSISSASEGTASENFFSQRETLDFMNELCVLLFLAQERHRDSGATPAKPGEGKWYTERARWGGGEGGEMGNLGGNTDEVSSTGGGDGSSGGGGGGGASRPSRNERHRDKMASLAAEARALARSGGRSTGGGGKEGRGEKPRMSAAEAWKVVKPGTGHWDQKVEFRGIGRERGEVWDQVFLISAMNHHISILKLRVHAAYIEFLSNGELPKTPPEEEDWCNPVLQRSEWFDWFDKEQRVEAMRGIWGVMSYQMRRTEVEVEAKAEGGKGADVQMKGE
ncbi:MAG: hypothetical protein M1820_008013 [Bogoriella megaspora]|nr:MAG: hypothetical protein M1820_008013 [Bogoriella megaspora]